jgi:hypothetical protein
MIKLNSGLDTKTLVKPFLTIFGTRMRAIAGLRALRKGQFEESQPIQ